MVDVVGLRYVEEGLQEVLRGQQQYQRSTDATVRGMKVAVNQTNQNAKSLDRLTRDVLQAEREIQLLAQAMSVGAIEGRQFQAAINSMVKQLRALGLDNAQSEVMRYARAQADLARETEQAGNAIARQSTQVQNAMRSQADATHLATRGMSRMGVITQQAGYQVGDFLVQIQSGTNFMVAFGQQATQLIGTFAMLAKTTRGIAFFSALGVAVPIITAIGAAITRTSEETQKLSFDFRAFGSDVMASLEPIAPVIDAIGGAVSAVGSAFSAFANLVVSNLDTILVASAGVAAAFIGPIVAALGAATSAMVAFTVATLTNPIVLGATAIAATVALVYELSKSLGSVGEALGLVGQAMLEMFSLDSLYNGLRSLNARIIASFLTLVADLASLGGKLVTALGEPFNQAAAIATGVVGGIREVWDALPAMFQNVGARAANFFIDGMEKLAGGAVAALNKVIEGLNSVLDFIGADKALEWFGFSGTVSTIDPPDFSSWRASVSEQARGIGESFSAGFAKGYDQSVAATPVLDTLEALVVQADGAATTFNKIADAFGEKFLEANPALTKIIEQIKAGENEVSALADYFRTVDEDTKGGAGSAGKPQDDYLAGLLAEAEYKRSIVGLDDEEMRRREILFELKKRELPLNDERIEQIIQTEAETRKLIEAEQQREQLMQTIEGNIKSAFMSMVDGSQSVEDAFRNMLRNILLAVYEQQVAQPAATAIGSLISGLFNANGNVFSGGSRVTAYANGGVVNSPTYFPMSSGVGLMGEAGPEAIMPLKRGANGKLGVQVDGNAGNVTVVQNFNIAANGDESVRRIVRQEAPRIAEQAKAAVVDAKRRGGTYGRSF